MASFLGKSNRSWPLMVALLLLLGLMACGSGGQKSLEKGAALVKNRSQKADVIVLITIDTWRHDAWGAGGNQKVKTPNLDRLAAEGVVFANAYAHNTVTLPSHASILTGLFGYQHGIRDNAGFHLPSDVPTLAQYLKQAGYNTGAFVSAFPLDSRYGLTTGFDVYDDAFSAPGSGAVKVPERAGEETLKRASAWLEAQTGPSFMWLHVYEPHFPYAPPEPFATEYADHPYLGEVAYTDAYLAPLFSYLRERDNAMLVVTSDHGESLGEHGELTHGVFAYNATLKIPLMFWAPKHLKSGMTPSMARHVDVMSSILDLNGMQVPDNIPGQSLFSPDFEEDTSYFESLSTYINRGWAPLRGCLDTHYKAIDLPQAELYDLNADPNERDNLALSQPERVSAFLACLPDEPELGADRNALSPEEVANLQALGYVTSTPKQGDEGPKDPKLMIDTDRAFQQALQSFGSGNHQQGIQALEKLIADTPLMLVAYLYLSDFYDTLGRTDQSIETMKKAVSAGIRNEQAYRKLALYLAGAGKPDEAWQLMTRFHESDDPETCIALGKILGGLGKPAEAAKAFRKALAADPGNPQATADLGTLALMTGRDREAAALFDQALAANDTLADAWNGLGVIRSRAGDTAGAIEAWESAIKHNPRLHFCYYNLAITYQKAGNKELAIERLRAYIPLVGGEQREKALKMLKNLQE